MAKLSFFWILALLLVQGPLVLAEDLCENVSRQYEDLCEEIVDLDLGYDETVDLIEHIDEVETYEPIPESRFEKDYCTRNTCLIPQDLSYKIDEEKTDSFLNGVIFFGTLWTVYLVIKIYWGKVWHLVAS